MRGLNKPSVLGRGPLTRDAPDPRDLSLTHETCLISCYWLTNHVGSCNQPSKFNQQSNHFGLNKMFKLSVFLCLCCHSVVSSTVLYCPVFLSQQWLMSIMKHWSSPETETERDHMTTDKSLSIRCRVLETLTFVRVVLERLQVPEQLTSVRIYLQPLPAPIM